jgi:hypothetical protein
MAVLAVNATPENGIEPPFNSPTTRCARCGKDGAPLYDPTVDMEVCPDCDEYLRNYADG